jgi:F-type H+-transporting ATPase subunit b
MEFNGTFLVTIISFILFVFLMNKILYAPVLGIMEERKNFIDSNYKNAEDNDNKIQELVAEHDKKITEAKGDARSRYNKKVDEFKSKKADIVREAQETAGRNSERTMAELGNLSNDVKEGLKGKMTDLASDIVEKVLGYRSEVKGFDNDKVNDVLYH